APKRVNVFIGEPNSGKSNLLEALALLSSGTSQHLREILRVRQPADLFFDHEIDNEIGLNVDNQFSWKVKFEKQHAQFAVNSKVLGQPPHATYFQGSISAWPHMATS